VCQENGILGYTDAKTSKVARRNQFFLLRCYIYLGVPQFNSNIKSELTRTLLGICRITSIKKLCYTDAFLKLYYSVYCLNAIVINLRMAWKCRSTNIPSWQDYAAAADGANSPDLSEREI
jgi:hypothetical protein